MIGRILRSKKLLEPDPGPFIGLTRSECVFRVSVRGEMNVTSLRCPGASVTLQLVQQLRAGHDLRQLTRLVGDGGIQVFILSCYQCWVE